MNQLEIKIITNIEEFEGLKKEWEELLDSCQEPTVFDTWQWQYLCARHLVRGKNLHILTLFDDNCLKAILPLYRKKVKFGGMFPVQTLCCLGESITDYNSLIVSRKHLSGTVEVLANELKKLNYPLQFDNVLPESPLDNLCRHLKKKDFESIIYESKFALASNIEGGYDNFLKQLKKKFRKNIRQNQNYMDRKGGYEYNFEHGGSKLLSALIKLHTSRWKTKGEAGALVGQRINDFHNELGNMMGRPFEIYYFTIRHNEKIAAILYGFLYRDAFYAYLSGFDTVHNRISPGNMIFNYCIRELSKLKISKFDMLRGDMKYKQSWATTSYDMKDKWLFPPSFSRRRLYDATRALQVLKRIIPKSLKKSLKSVFRLVII
jgi:hypothetical protein